MFKVEIIVDGKRLPTALNALAGLGYNMNVMPIRNAEVAGGKVRESGDATSKETLLKMLERTSDQVKRSELIHYATEHGHSYGAANQAVQQLLKEGNLRKLVPGVYVVNK